MLTVMVYLNDVPSGGETEFQPSGFRVIPKAGTVLVFQHDLLHQGAEVLNGTKYVLRTDVMYHRP